MNKTITLLAAGLFLISIILLISILLLLSSDESAIESVSRSSQSASGAITASQPDSAPEELSSLKTSAEVSTFTIVCHIKNSSDQSMENASVTLESIPGSTYQHSASTDVMGVCRLIALHPGQYKLSAKAEGYTAAEETLTISRHTNRKQLRVLVLQPPAYTLYGRILSHDNTPVSGARIYCASTASTQTSFIPETEQFSQASPHAVSQPDGSFIIKNLASSSYLLYATADGCLPNYKKIQIKHDHTEITRLDAKARLDGIIRDQWNRAVANATVTISSQGDDGVFNKTVISQANGCFKILGLPPHNSTLTASADGYQTSRKEIDISLSGHNTNLTLDAASISITGKLIHADTKQPLENISLELYDYRVGAAHPTLVQKIISSANGSFQFKDVIPAIYTIRFDQTDHRQFVPHAISLPLSLRNISNVVFEIEQYGTATGKVTDQHGQPIANAEVELLTNNSDLTRVMTDQQGRYIFPRLSTARQIKQSEEESGRLMASHPDYAAGCSDAFKFKTGQNLENIDITLNQGISINGKVFSQQARPIPNALVFCQSFPKRGDRRETYTDNKGNYLLTHIPLKSLDQSSFTSIGASADEYELLIHTVELSGQDINGRNFVLRNAKELAGQVLLPDGSPAAGAKLMLMVKDAYPKITSSDDNGCFQFKNIPETSEAHIAALYGESRYQYPAKLREQRDMFGYGAYFAYKASLQAGDKNISIRLQPENGVIGQVSDNDSSAPITDFRAVLSYQAPGSSNPLTWSIRSGQWISPSPGEFGFSAPLIGEFTLTITSEGYRRYRSKINFEENAIVKTLDIKLSKIN